MQYSTTASQKTNKWQNDVAIILAIDNHHMLALVLHMSRCAESFMPWSCPQICRLMLSPFLAIQI